MGHFAIRIGSLSLFPNPRQGLIIKLGTPGEEKGEMEVALAILLALAVFVGIPAAIGFGIVGLTTLLGRTRVAQTRVSLVCSIDADCPPGYKCVEGRCVPA